MRNHEHIDKSFTHFFQCRLGLSADSDRCLFHLLIIPNHELFDHPTKPGSRRNSDRTALRRPSLG